MRSEADGPTLLSPRAASLTAPPGSDPPDCPLSLGMMVLMLWLLNWLLHLSLPFLSLPRTRGICMWFAVCICVHMCVRTWKPEVDIICLPPLLFLRQGLSLNPCLTD